MRTFDHNSLMKIFGVYESQNSIYILVELLDRSLCSFVGERSFEKKRRIMKNLLEGVLVLHKKGYMHRDLKPENILLRSKTSEFVIADFGLC